MTDNAPQADLLAACGRLLRSVRVPRDRAEPLARFWAPAERIDLPAGATLLREGDRGDALLFVLSGTIAVSIRDHNGTPIHVAQLRTPMIIGTTGAVDGQARMATCTLATPGTVLRMRRGVFVDTARRATPEAEVVRELLLLTMHKQLIGANQRLRRTLEASR